MIQLLLTAVLTEITLGQTGKQSRKQKLGRKRTVWILQAKN